MTNQRLGCVVLRNAREIDESSNFSLDRCSIRRLESGIVLKTGNAGYKTFHHTSSATLLLLLLWQG